MNTSPMLWVSLLIILIYSPTFFYDFSLDDFLVTEPVDGKIQTLSDAFGLWTQRFNKVDYRPVSMFSFGLEYLILGKLHPGVSHFVNVLLWIAVVWSGYQLLQQITENKQPKTVFWTVLLFSCLPINVEMVASIKSRDNLFSLLFTFWSLRLLILPLKKENLLKHAGGLTLYFLALVAKLDAAGLVIFTPIYHLIATSPIFNVKKLARSALFLYILFMITFHLRMNVLYNFIATADFTTDIGKVTFTENPAAIFNHSIDKLAAALYTNIIYLQKILIPFDLRYYYGFKYYEFPAFISLTILSASVFHFLAIGVLGWAIVNKKKAISVGILGYICFIAYALNLAAPMAGVVADRYAAQSTIWMMLLVSSLLMMIPQKKISVALLTTLLVFFSCVSAYRVTAWKDGITLIERDAPHLEKSYEGMRIAASVYKTEADSAKDETLKKSYLQKALHCAQKANEIYPQNTLMNSYEGSYWFELGNYEKAIEKFRDALSVDSNKINTLTFLGDVFYTSRQPDSSLFYYQKAFAINKNNPVLINNISTVYYESGQKQAALQFNLDLIEKDSTTGAAWENLGYYYLAEKDSAMAIQHFKRAIQYGLSPTAIPVFIK